MKGKKQEIGFFGINKNGQRFITGVFEHCVMESKDDPVPVNRKSRRAMLKIINGMENDTRQENPETNRAQKKKRKATRKASYLSKRFNRIRSRAS